jgi:phosphohistidine phosphatase
MKRLILIRHAKSSWDDPVERDFDRPLNAKGKRAAETMGRHMRNLDIDFEKVVASPAMRVVETIESLAIGLDRVIEPEWDRRAYLASNMTLLDIVHEQPDTTDSLLLAGHNSGLEDLVLLLVPDTRKDEARAAVEEKFPTCSLAVMTFDTDRWEQIAPGSGTLDQFVRPRDLDKKLGPDDI